MQIDPTFTERLGHGATATSSFMRALDFATVPGARAGVVQLTALARALAQAPRLWQPLVRHDPVERWYAHLLHNDVLEIWLIGWEVGQDIELHDHGDSSGAVVVCDGALDEQHTRLGGVEPLRARRHDRSATFDFGPGYVHSLGNPGPDPATSVHVYAPPLARMRFYEYAGGYLRCTRSLPVAGPDPGVRRRRRAQPVTNGMVS